LRIIGCIREKGITNMIRNAAKALIVHHGKILLNKNQNSLGDMCSDLPDGAIYYDLPGGGQNQYETLEEAVKRECLEETGYTITVDKLSAIYEEISVNEQFRSEYERHAHKIHFIFVCHLINEHPEPLAEDKKDLDLLGSEWVKLENVKNILLYPLILNTNLERIFQTETIINLGYKRVL